MTDTTKPRPAIRTPFKILGLIILGCFALAVFAAMFAPDDKQQPAAQPTRSEPVTHAAPFTVRRVLVTGANTGNPVIEIYVTETTGTEANRAATVKAIAQRVLHDNPQADSVFANLIRPDLPAGANEVLAGEVAHANYDPHDQHAAQPWTVVHSSDAQIVPAHEVVIGDAFGELQDKMEAAAGKNADIDAVDEKVRLAIIRKYKLPATWQQQDVPLANGSTDDGAGPANINTSAAETSLKVIDACVKNNGCDDEQAKTFADVVEGGAEPLTAGSPMMVQMQNAGCTNMQSFDDVLAAIKKGDSDAATVALAGEVQAGNCEMLQAGERAQFVRFGGSDDELAAIRLANGDVVWMLAAGLVGVQ
jgi:hypothetical protein